MNQHINHIAGLIPSLKQKVEGLLDEAAYANECKDGRSVLAKKLQALAEEMSAQVADLEETLKELQNS